jgi:hypothetical protein
MEQIFDLKTENTAIARSSVTYVMSGIGTE